jgi:hypothetical protein
MKRSYQLFAPILILMLLMLSFSLHSAEEQAKVAAVVGKVVAGSGTLLVRELDGDERSVKRQSPIFVGDTIMVGKNGFIQLRFTDGTLVALRSDSEFLVEEYEYQESEHGNGKLVFNLLKGGLRTISGAIGKKNQENYQMKTPVASIGIRGTMYGLMYCVDGQCSGVDDGLYGGVLEGMIAVEVEGDDGLVKKNGFFFVTPDGKVFQLLSHDPSGVVFGGKGVSGKDGNGKDGMGWDGLKGEEPVYQAPRNIEPPVQHPGPGGGHTVGGGGLY